MSIAPLLTKCSSSRTSCAGHFELTHSDIASPSGRVTGSSHDGHLSGIWKSRSQPVRRPVMTLTTCGITSPARSTTTQSPMRRSLALM